MQTSGLIPRAIVADGRWYRCATEDKPRKRNGAYLLAIDGRRGWWKNYALESDFNTWTSQESMPVDCARLASRARANAQQEAKQRADAVRKVRAYFDKLAPLNGGHPYLSAKGLTAQGCGTVRRDGDLLVIPVRLGQSLMSVQTISPSGVKLFAKHCPVGGGWFEIGSPGASVTCLAEGFATGLAVYQSAPNLRVIVCFDAGNMVKVARSIRLSGLAVVCADNDRNGKVNTGVEKGLQAAQALGCGIAYPEGIAGSDWADALQEWRSPVRVRMEIMRRAKVAL
jgi:putative DNA primase/helicase